MTALIVIFSILAYLGVALQASRHLSGHFRYAKYLNENIRREYDQWKPYSEDYKVGAFMIAFGVLPLALMMCAAYGGRTADGKWEIDPKHVRKDRELKAAKARIAELEATTGVAL